MTAYFAYSYRNRDRDIYMDPVRAYKQLCEKYRRSSFHDFIMKGTDLAPPSPGERNALNLGGDNFGAVLMCGTTSDLQHYLSMPLANPPPVAIYSPSAESGSLFA